MSRFDEPWRFGRGGVYGDRPDAPPFADVPPVEALYGGASGFGPDHMYAGHERFEPDYLQWRQQQMRELDRDYVAWRATRHRPFGEEFDEWRRGRAMRAEAAGGEGSKIGLADNATARSVSESDVGKGQG